MAQAAPLLLGAMIGALLGLVAWGFRRSRETDAGSGLRARDDVLLGFAIFAGVVLALSVLYFFLILAGR